MATLTPSDFTLYSGAAAGTEAAFGEAAERWGLEEVNFTFDGHQDVRTRGQQLLSDAELSKGFVSLSYVAQLMHRVYKDTPLFRKTLALQWHLVNAADQVFSVGWVKDDGTVKGGTGWGAELAKLFRKELYVFDQSRGEWLRWDHLTWVPADAPKITAQRFAATGTRLLEDNGRAAIEALFERSFGQG